MGRSGATMTSDVLELVGERGLGGIADADSDSNRTRNPDLRHFEVRERWEGTVESVQATYFVARLVNLATDEPATALINIEDVPFDDRALVEPGNLFFWHVGYRTRSDAEREKISTLRFRRGLGSDNVRVSADAWANWLSDDD